MKDNLIAGKAWFKKRGWCPFPFQLEAWEAYLKGRSGVVNAPTGSGKTYSLVVPIILEALGDGGSPKRGLQAIWLTPIRALAKEIKYAAELAIAEMGLDWEVGVRSGDTPVGVRKRQKESPP
ncbi:MAG TPA: DEAD/DEAH box helicase, partial [Cyclobacteriaceae bacterium]|nr:DEAD/DEAH box helicase [Cyclobacteriaceae bacterium]